MIPIINLVIDYKKDGAWMHQAYQALLARDEYTAALAAIAQIQEQGGVPLAVHRIYGQYTLDELDELEKGPHRLVWCDFQRMRDELEAEGVTQ